MKLFLFLFILFDSLIIHASPSFSLEAIINNFNAQRVYLADFHDGKTILLDSTSVLDGKFIFPLKDNYKPGLYRVILGDMNNSGFNNVGPEFLDFIFNAENIKLEADYDSLIESMKILKSKENEIFYTFLKILKQYNQKFFLLKSLLDVYSHKDSFYVKLSDEFIDIQQNNSQALIDLEERLPGSMVSSIIKINFLPIIHPSISGPALSEFYKEHYFDLVTFTDERLLNSQVYDKKILEYLGFFKNPSLSPSEQERAFIIGVDKIMDKASINPVIYDYMLNFLIDGFDKLKFESVLVYIANNYVEGGCDTNSKKLMEKRLEGYQKMAIGKKVPDIIMLNENGKQFRLYDLKNEYVLVLFWVSWCPHCSNMIPQLKKWYLTKSINLQVYAVSIDSSRFAWEENLMMNNYPWINTCTFAGWNDKAAKDYNLYATPTMFLLDRERKIIAKPMTFREFRKEVDKLE